MSEYCFLLQVKTDSFLNWRTVSFTPRLVIDFCWVCGSEAHRLTIIPQFNSNNLDKWSWFLLILCPQFPINIQLLPHLMLKICCNSFLKQAFCFALKFPNVQFYHQNLKCKAYIQLLWVFLINQLKYCKIIGFLLNHIGYYLGFVWSLNPFEGSHMPNYGQFPVMHTHYPGFVWEYAEKWTAIRFLWIVMCIK